MRFLKFLFVSLLSAMTPFSAVPQATDKTAYDFQFDSIEGKKFSLEEFRGKVILIVNTASKCGFTKQYKGLEEIWKELKDQGLVVIGVPSNDFGGQEPAPEKDIKEFCEMQFGISFPMTSKYVVSGKEAHPFYQWAETVLKNPPAWNFHKYLIDRQGNLVGAYGSMTSPDSDKLRAAIKEQLDKK